MEMRKRNFQFGTNNSHEVDFPINCPFCGLPTALTENTSTRTGSIRNQIAVIQVLYSTCCSKYSFAFYILQDNKYTFQFMYPSVSDIYFEDSIQNISPRFVNLYRGASLAEDHGYIELAGSGYRNALEVLIKDFAIKEQNKPENEVAKKDLFTVISDYLPDELLQNSADVVRILGNDFTHYQRKYEELGLDVLKSYLDIFKARIHAEYLMKHPPVQRNQK